jgi:hypothetical protein
LYVVLSALSFGSTPDEASPNIATASKNTQPLPHRQRGDLALGARQILQRYCSPCHDSAQPHGRFRALEPQQMLRTDLAVPWIKPGEPDDSQLIHFVQEGSMPPGNRPRPTQAEIRVLREWIAQGAPAFPTTFDQQYIIATLTHDLDHLGANAPYSRYVSFVHRCGEAPQTMSLARWEADLRAGLQRYGINNLDPVDAAATIFRYDLRPAWWHSRELFLRQQQGLAVGMYPLSPYDLLLLEYPEFEPLGHPQAWPATVRKYLDTAQLLRPIPYIRGDWLIAQLTTSPLSDELSSLTILGRHLQQQHWPPPGREKDLPCGPAPRPFQVLKFTVPPKVTQPVTAWYPLDTGHLPTPFGITAELIDLQGQRLTRVHKRQRFQLQIRTPRDVYFVLLMIWCTGHIEIQQTNRDGFLPAGEHRLTPREAEAFRITDILTGEKETHEYFLLLASSQPLPTITLIRSRHAQLPQCEQKLRYSIERFLFEQPPTTPIERVLVPIPLQS